MTTNQVKQTFELDDDPQEPLEMINEDEKFLQAEKRTNENILSNAVGKNRDLTKYVCQLEQFIVQIGHDLNAQRKIDLENVASGEGFEDLYGENSFAPMLDLALMDQYQPLLFSQQAYIGYLEEQATTHKEQIKSIEIMHYQAQKKQDNEIENLQGKYQEIQKSYHANLIEMAAQKRALEREREDYNKHGDLLKAANESLVTINVELKRMVEQLEVEAIQKDKNSTALREKIDDLSSQNTRLKQSEIQMQSQIERLEASLQSQTTQNESLTSNLLEKQTLSSQLQNKLVATFEQLSQMKSALDEANETHRSETEFNKNEVLIYRKRLNEIQLEVQKWETQGDELRFENNLLKGKLKEMGKDCEVMGNVLDEEAQRYNKLDARDQALKLAEAECKQQKETLQQELDQSHLKAAKLQKLEQKLIIRQEELDGELQKRLNSILETERNAHFNEVTKQEQEIKEVNGQLALQRHQYDTLKAEWSSVQSECKRLKSLVMQLTEEKTSLCTELYQKLQHEKDAHDKLQHQQEQLLQDRITEVRNLQYSLESSQARQRELEVSQQTQFQELSRSEEEVKNARDRIYLLDKDLRSIESRLGKENQHLRDKLQEITLEFQTRQLNAEAEQSRFKEEKRELETKSRDICLLQERIANQWKQELQRTSEAYERVCDQLKAENAQLTAENNSWHAKVAAVKAKRIEARKNRPKTEFEVELDIIPSQV